MAKSEASKTGWYFFLIVIGIYIITAIIKPSFLAQALAMFKNIIIRILPVFVMVFAIMFIINYFITPRKLVNYLEKNKGAKAWAIAIVSGIISTGPIYMWYPLLAELKEHGIKQGLIAAFLYARAIKPALIPLMIFYFGWAFTLVLTGVMIVFSIVQGTAIDKIIELKE